MLISNKLDCSSYEWTTRRESCNF